jgi:hypothetical protein
MPLAWRAAQDIHDRTGEVARDGHLLLHGAELLGVGEVAMPEKVSRFLKRDRAHEFVDFIPADD